MSRGDADDDELAEREIALERDIVRIDDLDEGQRQSLYAELLAVYGPMVKRVVARTRRFARDPRDGVEDMAQEVFLRVVMHSRSYRAKAGSLRAWIFRIAARQAMDARRRGRRHRRRQETISDPRRPRWQEASDRFVGQLAMADELQSMLSRLGANERVAVSRRYLEGKSIETIAAAMGRTPKAVRGLIYRALRRLRRILSRRGESRRGEDS
jgi:RNA polymerase sigma-70 factor (ECF subfamily)